MASPDSYKAIARDLVAMMFWRYRSSHRAFIKLRDSGFKEDHPSFITAWAQETESWNAFVSAYYLLDSRVRGDQYDGADQSE